VEGSLPDFDQLWDYDHPAETEVKFQALLGPARESGSMSYTIQLLTQIARTHSLRGNSAEAQRLLDEAQGLLNGKTTTAQVRLLLERGRAFNSAGQVEQARPLFQQAWGLARAAGEDFHAVDAAHMLGIAAPPEERMIWNRQALAAAEASADPRAQGWAGSLYNNLGWTEHDAGHHTEALVWFRQALAFQEARGQARSIGIARWCLARCLRSLGRAGEALEIQQALATGDEDGFVFEEIGECLLALGRAGEAPPFFARAYGLLSRDAGLASAEPARLERLRQLGQA
jgi:tetratricopeptide (TPR) repeat protein